MAVLAHRAQQAFVLVIVLVAIDAAERRFPLLHWPCMAGLAFRRSVLAEKRKFCARVIECDRLPTARDMTVGAGRAIAAFVHVILAVTACAIARQRRSHRLHVARLAADRRVPADQRKACPGVVERSDLPRLLIVT